MDQRADRRRTLHRIRQPGIEGDLRRLADRPDEQAEGDGRGHLGRQFTGLREDLRVVQRAEIHEDQKDRQEEAGVADPVDHEGLGRRLGRRHLVVVVADEQVGAEPDALPSDEEDDIVVPHHQQEHRDHEEVHVGEEAREAFLPVHVPDRIQMDQEADPRDDQQHDAGERIDQEGEVDREIAAEDPGIGNDLSGLAEAKLIDQHGKGAEKGQADRPPGQPMGDVMGIATAQKAVRHHRQEREHRDQYDDEIVHVTTSANSFHPRWWRSCRGTPR